MTAPLWPPFGDKSHGHVMDRPDGVKARCGGVKMCPQCAAEAQEFKSPTTGGDMNVDAAARVIHAAVVEYLKCVRDYVTLDRWELSQAWEREETTEILRFVLINDGKTMTPAMLHAYWCDKKIERGWRFGPGKNLVTHENFWIMDYESLKEWQKRRWQIFLGMARALAPLIDAESLKEALK